MTSTIESDRNAQILFASQGKIYSMGELDKKDKVEEIVSTWREVMDNWEIPDKVLDVQKFQSRISKFAFSKKQSLDARLTLFTSVDKVICCVQDATIERFWEKNPPSIKAINTLFRNSSPSIKKYLKVDIESLRTFCYRSAITFAQQQPQQKQTPSTPPVKVKESSVTRLQKLPEQLRPKPLERQLIKEFDFVAPQSDVKGQMGPSHGKTIREGVDIGPKSSEYVEFGYHPSDYGALPEIPETESLQDVTPEKKG